MAELIRDYYKPTDMERFDFILSNLPEGVRTVLDVGAWDDLFKQMLDERGYQALAVDFAPHGSGVIKADITRLPFKDNSFDLTTALEVLEHLDARALAKALVEIRRVTTQYVVVSVPYSEVPLGKGHRQCFPEKRMRNLFKGKCIRTAFCAKRPAYRGIRRQLGRIDRRILGLFNIIFGDTKGQMDNWIVGVFHLGDGVHRSQ